MQLRAVVIRPSATVKVLKRHYGCIYMVEGEGHVPTIKPGAAHDVVDTFNSDSIARMEE